MLRQLKWLTLLSLDAPLVAVAWQALYAQAIDNKLAWHYRLLIFASVWLGYVADRWFDNRANRQLDSERHRFNARHARRALAVWLIVLASSIALAILKLSPLQLANGFALVAASLLYTAFAQRCRSIAYYGIAKSMLVAGLLAASVALFPELSQATRPQNLAALSLLALLFSLNCFILRSWEKPSSLTAKLVTPTFALTLLLAAIVSIFWSHFQILCAAAIISSIALRLLHRSKPRLEENLARTLADVSLLTPFPILLLTWQSQSQVGV